MKGYIVFNVAEIGSAFRCADLEITIEPREDHAIYIVWLSAYFSGMMG